ncbi:MAG TPA: insulinase family protein [candidate division Zixibacteria bacterium]|nr:insulinase family protein [candidate division Zixibacteria bacterium]
MRFAIIMIGLLLLISVSGLTSDWQITKLDNGLKVMIMENHQVPQVNISTTVKVGAKNETDFFHGATHLLEHLILFRGTEEMTGEELGDAMKAHGAYFNGYTSADWTDFVISLPRENLDFALKIHADMLFRSDFPKEEMDKERQAVLEEINISEDSPTSKAYWSTLKELYGNHPYSRSVLGTKERVKNIPRDSVYAYYKRYYAPNNMTMVIVGDIDAVRTIEKVREYFGDFPSGWEAEDIYAPPPKRDKVSEIKITKDINQAYLMMSTIGPKADSPDQFPLDIMANLLGSGESSRFWKKLKDEKGLVYSADFNFYTSKYEGIMFSFATLDPANIPAAEEAINEILHDVIQNGFTERELRKAKNSIKTDYYLSMERGLNMADNYAQYDSHIGYQYIENYPDSIEIITLDRLNTAAKKYLTTDSYVKTMVVPK